MTAIPWLIALDMDSTFIEQEVIDLIAAQAGVEAEVASITEQAMRGEIDFQESLSRRVGKLKGVKETEFAIVRSKISFSPGAEELVRTAHLHGHKVAIFSGGFLNVISPILESLAIDYFTANTLEVIDGALTGRTVGEIIDASAKAEHLKIAAEKFNIPLDRTMAIGDGANDILMMNSAAISVAYNGKPKAVAAADHSFNNRSLVELLDLITS